MCIRGNKVSPEQTRQKKTLKKADGDYRTNASNNRKKKNLTATNLKHQRKPVWAKK